MIVEPTLGVVAAAVLGTTLAGIVVALLRSLPIWQRLVAGVLVAVATAALTMMPAPWASDPELEAALPTEPAREGFTSSATCVSCHPGRYASWHRSYHRTMTQVADPTAVVAPFDGRTLEGHGQSVTVTREGDAYYASTTKGRRRVVFTTGSHQLQAYWVEGNDGLLTQMPFVYLIREQRWLHNEDSFLHPPRAQSGDISLDIGAWSDGCAPCHTTGTKLPPLEDTSTKAGVSDLGIACEACHGPGQEHIAVNQSPVRRYELHLSGEADDTIVNPRRLNHMRSTAVCGQCHSSVGPSELGGRETFVAGDRFDDHFSIDLLHQLYESAMAAPTVDELDDQELDARGTLWPDHTVRVAGREYNGLVLSECFTKGDISCLSCHDVHGGPPSKQMAAGRTGDGGCVSCHADVAAEGRGHTHHEVGSSGAECTGCHMPYIAYGLLMATRSHRIDSPTTSGVGTGDRPNACNLCHLDQPLAWTNAHLVDWYGQDPVELPERHKRIAAGLVWGVMGDAAQRGVVAWNAGWEPSREAVAANDNTMTPMLSELLNDDYAAVRQTAAAALRKHDTFADIVTPTTAEEGERLRRELLPRLGREAATPSGPLLVGDEGWDPTALGDLRARRDNAPTWIAE